MRALGDEDAAERARLDFFGHLSGAAATSFARAVSSGRAERGEFSLMADELAGGTGAALARRRDITGRKRTAKKELGAAMERLAAAQVGLSNLVELVEVRATLEVEAKVEVLLEVSYHVSAASWQPLYDLRLDGERLGVSYLAEITQRSGEDWPPVELSLSTTRSGHHSSVPELSPWFIGRAALRSRAFSAMEPGAGQDNQYEGAFGDASALSKVAPTGSVEAAGMAQAPPMVARVEEPGAAQVYKVPALMPVPSDGAPYKTTVALFELDAALDHLTIPKLAPEVYLRATVTNSSGVLLLPGPANVFHDAEYVGATRLKTVAPGEDLELQLGIDERVRVERELRRRSTSKAIIGGTRSIDVAYEITVENHRDRPVRVTVQDQLPTSRDGDIKVKPREATPKVLEQDDLGELTWKLELGPGDKSVVRFAFTVEHPANVALSGL
jgi:uncharacterized protein (TIGR02231 family)